MHLFMLITFSSGNCWASFAVIWSNPFDPEMSVWVFPFLAFSESSHSVGAFWACSGVSEGGDLSSCPSRSPPGGPHVSVRLPGQ